MLAKRLGILFLVKENKPDNVIAETLKVSLPTPARIRLQNKLVKPEATTFLFKKLENWQDFSAFKNALEEIGLNLLKTFSRGMAGRI